MKIYCDGSSNSFSSAICFFIDDERYLKVVDKEESVVLEFRALIWGLKNAECKAEVFSDCKEAVDEINGTKKIKESHMIFIEECREFLKNKNCTLGWVSRNENPAGIYLEERLKKVREDMLKTLRPKLKKKRKF